MGLMDVRKSTQASSFRLYRQDVSNRLVVKGRNFFSHLFGLKDFVVQPQKIQSTFVGMPWTKTFIGQEESLKQLFCRAGYCCEGSKEQRSC